MGNKQKLLDPLILHAHPHTVKLSHGEKLILPGYNSRMYIIFIGWLYVILMMALTETSIVAGVLTFCFYGLMPVSILWYLFRPRRRPTAIEASDDMGLVPPAVTSLPGVLVSESLGKQDGDDTQTNQEHL